MTLREIDRVARTTLPEEEKPTEKQQAAIDKVIKARFSNGR